MSWQDITADRRLQIEDSILRTVLYADVFDYCLSLQQVFRLLISPVAVALPELADVLEGSRRLHLCLKRRNGCVVARGRESLLELRVKRDAYTACLWPRALTFGKQMSTLPFVRAVAISGALAAGNPTSSHDDVDYFIITASGRVWFARALVILMVRAGRLSGFEICPNFMLAQHSLVISDRDVFTAHEIAQLRPVAGLSFFSIFFEENQWVRKFLPNFELAPKEAGQLSGLCPYHKRILETCLAGRLGDLLESWEYGRKLREFEPKFDRPGHSAIMNPNCVKGHFQDHRKPSREAYAERLRRYGVPDLSEQEGSALAEAAT